MKKNEKNVNERQMMVLRRICILCTSSLCPVFDDAANLNLTVESSRVIHEGHS